MSSITSIFSRSNAQRYSLTGDDDETLDGEAQSFLPEKRRAIPNSTSSWRLIGLWILSTALFTSLAVYLDRRAVTSRLGTYEKGWKTDFEPARQYISTEQVRFTGSPAFDLENNYFVPNPDPITYVGDPSPEVDRAWDELTWGRYILITRDEAVAALTDTFGDVEQFWSPKRGGYIAGVDMFHTLHCLVYLSWGVYNLLKYADHCHVAQNRLREDLYPDYYPMNPHPNHKLHQSHCIEQIRQYIMCAGDMSLTPTRYNPTRKGSYIDSDVKHTCRNFGPLREFLSERFNGSKAVPPICPEDKTFPEQGSRSCVISE